MIPASFPPGFISIYGTGSTQGFTGYPTGTYSFGVVNQLSGGGSGAYPLGANVLFPYSQSIPLIYGNQKYYLVQESSIVLTENVVVIEPEA